MRTRDWRRTQSNRVKQKFYNKLKSTLYQDSSLEWLDWYIIRNYNNRKPCNCWMCKNPRKLYKDKTLQEKRFIAGMEKE